MKVYKISVLQYPEDYSTGCREFEELYDSVDAVKRAWNEMNTSLLGTIEKEEFLPDFEVGHPFGSVVRKNGRWITHLSCSIVTPKTEDDIKREGSFSFDRHFAGGYMVTTA